MRNILTHIRLYSFTISHSAYIQDILQIPFICGLLADVNFTKLPFISQSVKQGSERIIDTFSYKHELNLIFFLEAIKIVSYV